MDYPARSCAQSGCRRRTTHLTGACHSHRAGRPRAHSGGGLPFPIDFGPDEVWSAVYISGSVATWGYRVEEWSTGHVFGRTDGPWRVTYCPSGDTIEEWPLHREQSAKHRLNGPARIYLRADGSVATEQWYFEGCLHRVDGPALKSYDPTGAVTVAGYRLGGSHYDRESFVRKLLLRDRDVLAAEFENSSYGPLLAGGHPVDEILAVVADGVETADGIRQVFEGAPVEWVRSFESAQMLGSAAV